MKRTLHLAILAILAVLLLTPAAFAQTTTAAAPVVKKQTFADGAILTGLSDNGKWAVACAAYTSDANSIKGRLINVETGEVTEIFGESEQEKYGSCALTDVTDDGSLVVGTIGGRAAVYNVAKKAWYRLNTSGSLTGSMADAITPDGKYVVGRVDGDYIVEEGMSFYGELGTLWELSVSGTGIVTGKVLELSGLPQLDMTHEDHGQNRFTGISPDGRYILGTMSFSYIGPPSLFSYVYDRNTSTYKVIGFTENDTEAWTPKAEGLAFVHFPVMSANGKYVTGTAYMVKEQAGSSFPMEYSTSFVYDIEKDAITVHDKAADAGIIGQAVSGEGLVFGGTPVGDPLREWGVRYNGYWIMFDQIMQQHYGVDFFKTTNYERTGQPTAISADGLTLISLTDPRGESYILRLSEPIQEACKDIDLLGTYTASPASGAVFSKMKKVTLTFDYDIQMVQANATAAALYDKDGTLVRNSLQCEVDAVNARQLNVGFRTQTLNEGEIYTMVIPAGIFCISGDNAVVNKRIELQYTGRADQAVAITSVYPASGSEVELISYDGNPILLTFDTNVLPTDSVSAQIYQGTDTAPLCDLNLAYYANQVALYPATTQNLFKGQTYKVVIPAGLFTDESGSCPNERTELLYTGTYVRSISTSDGTLFSCNFNNMAESLATWMLYEGDHNTPDTEMSLYEFDADNTPWNFSFADVNSADYCAGSHSQYSPVGQSDDWMVTPQIYIPDEFCKLTFKGQSLRSSKEDRLLVLVLASEDNYNFLNDEIVDKFRMDADLLFDEQLFPGASDDDLAGDWVDYTVDLSAYAGKSIYIAFVNENDCQSMIFVDDVVVDRQMRYLLSISNEEAVVGQSEITISGTIKANAEGETFDTLEMVLTDGEGNEVSRISETGLGLQYGQTYTFAFPQPLPLELGTSNDYTISVKMNEISDVISRTVKNLVFKPTKRVILEEMTGVDCGNCPKGILAIEKIKEYAGNQFIPISIHTYDGDPYESGMTSYSNYLKLNGAPLGVVNRGKVSLPMWENPADGFYYFSDEDTHAAWLDLVQKELATPADCDLTVRIGIDEENQVLTLPVTVRYALDANNLNLSLLAVVLEDGLYYYQRNFFAQSADPNLGEWSNGGKYAAAYATNIRHDDVARAVIGRSFAGTSGYFPQSMKAGESVTATIESELPQNLSDNRNGKVVVMLLNGNTGSVVNASVISYGEATGIDEVWNDADASSQADSREIYDLSGRRVAHPTGRGFYIVGGQKVLVR